MGIGSALPNRKQRKQKHGDRFPIHLMLNDEIKINKFKKNDKKNQHTLTFKISEFGHELETNAVESKS
jgi:hypothetical protein